MNKILLGVLALAVVGAMGCSGSKSETAPAAKDAGTDAAKTGPDKGTDTPNPAGDSAKTSEVGTTDGTQQKPTPTADVKGAAYVGVYSIVVTPEMKKQMEGVKQLLASLPEKDRAKAKAEMETAIAAIGKLELHVNADGTYTFTGVPKVGDLKGTYTASGNELTFSAVKGAKGGDTPSKATYDAKTGTLTGTDKNGQKAVFKKKS